MTEKSNLSTAPQREAPWLEVLVQESGEDIPELTARSVCRVKASSGARMRSIGVVPWSLGFIPNGNIGDEVFLFFSRQTHEVATDKYGSVSELHIYAQLWGLRA